MMAAVQASAVEVEAASALALSMTAAWRLRAFLRAWQAVDMVDTNKKARSKCHKE